MTREDFIASFADGTKVLLMDKILGEVYDKCHDSKGDCCRIIQEHLGEFVEKSASDPRLMDMFIDDRILELRQEISILKG